MHRLLAGSLFLVACHAADAPVDGDDTDAPSTDTDVAATRCTGTVAFALDAVPAALGQHPSAWTDHDAALTTEPFTGAGGDEYTVLLESEQVDGCLRLHPGVLRVDLHDTRCGATHVRAEVVVDCGTTCTRLDVFQGDVPKGEDRSTRSGAEDVLELTTTDVFTTLTLSTTDARLCRLEIDLAPLPPALEPEDTAALF